jgi:hypothetical protein
MADPQSLRPIRADAPVGGDGAMASPAGVDFSSRESHFETSQIAVITQDSQEGESFSSRLRSPIIFNRLTLRPLPYFIYSIHPYLAAFTLIDRFGEKLPSQPPTGQNEPTKPMAPLPTAVVAPNDLEIAPGLTPIPIDLTTNDSTAPQPPTDRQRGVITHVMEKVWGISSPREFQVEAVTRLVFEPRTCLFLIRKTGEGKLAVVLTSATLLRGITLVVVPLLGLGCDQVAKAQRRRHKVEAYHLDENRGDDQVAIQTRLLSITQRRSQSIILFTSPQSLKEGSSWAPLLKCLAKRNLFSLLVCDEAHTVPLHGRSFWREFIEMRKGVLKSVFHYNPSLCVLAMLASFCSEEQNKFSSIMSVTPTHVYWGSMARRGIFFCVSVLGDIASSISNKIAFYLKHNATYKVILYTNTKSSAEGHLLTLVKKTMALNLVQGNAIPLTGDSGLMMKNWLVLLFLGAIQSPASNLRVLLATAAANCGISSTYSILAVRYGFPPTLIDLLQEMGRVNRGPRVPGDLQDRYHVYLNCSLFLSLLLRIKQEPVAKERSIQLKDLMDMMVR